MKATARAVARREPANKTMPHNAMPHNDGARPGRGRDRAGGATPVGPVDEAEVIGPVVDEEEDDGTGGYRKGKRRSRTIASKRLTKEEIRSGIELADLIGYDRPKNRSECFEGVRPCPFVACKHHLYLDVNPETGSIKLNFPAVDVWDMKETCALDIADRGGITLEEVGDILNLTRERIRQVEVQGLTKLRHTDLGADLDGELPGDDVEG